VSYGAGWSEEDFKIVTVDRAGRFTMPLPLGERIRMDAFHEDYEELQSHIDAGVDNDIIFSLKPIDDPCETDGRQVAGAGVQLDYPSDGSVVVRGVVADGPAVGKLPIRFTVDAIDGIPVAGREWSEVSLLSIGVAGSEVVFTGTRPGSTAKEDITVTRAPLFIDYEHPRWWMCDHITGRENVPKSAYWARR
jgi:hypothetical protein